MTINKDLTKGILIGAGGMGLMSTLMMTVQRKSSVKAINQAYYRGVRAGMDGLEMVNDMNDRLDKLQKDLKKFER